MILAQSHLILFNDQWHWRKYIVETSPPRNKEGIPEEVKAKASSQAELFVCPVGSGSIQVLKGPSQKNVIENPQFQFQFITTGEMSAGRVCHGVLYAWKVRG